MVRDGLRLCCREIASDWKWRGGDSPFFASKEDEGSCECHRNEMGTYFKASNGDFEEQVEWDDVEAIFLREPSVEQRGLLFQYLVG